MATKYRFSIDEFERMFADIRHVELIEGKVYQMSPMGPKHVYTVMKLAGLLTEEFSDRAVVSIQNALRIPGQPKDSEPEPDIALLQPPIEKYQERLPDGKDVLLLIEVSDSTLEHDRTTKQGVYARAGIPEYWIANLIENVLEVYRQPGPSGYQIQLKLKPGEAVEFMGEKLEWW